MLLASACLLSCLLDISDSNAKLEELQSLLLLALGLLPVFNTPPRAAGDSISGEMGEQSHTS